MKGAQIPHRVFMVGELDEGSTSFSRLRALRRFSREVKAVSTKGRISGLSLWQQALTNHLYWGPRVRAINHETLESARRFQPELLWVDKGLHLLPQTLVAIRRAGCRLSVHFSPDNMMIPANQSPLYLKAIPLYDVHITTKTHNIKWLIQRGARRVMHMGNGFDPDLHRPVTLTPKERERFGCDIGFVGHWEPSREETLFQLWKQGYRIKVWGGGWRRARRRRHPLFRESCHLVADEYVKALCGAKINLCFLSRWFFDRTTTRSVEIPACGAFMLAERNEEHLALFQEGVQAEFYSSSDEMMEKIKRYLADDDQREAIAQAGRARCLEGYSYEDRLRSVLSQVLQEQG